MTKITINTPGSGGSTSPGGSNKSVQYNDSGSFGGDVLFNFDETNTYLGIGTTTPSTTLSVEGSDQCVARFESTGVGGGIDLKDQNTTADNYVSVQAIGDSLQFISGGNARARLFANGNLVIGNALTDNGFQVETKDRDASFNSVLVGKGVGTNNTRVGTNSFISANAGANANSAFGTNALKDTTDGDSNSAFGAYALSANTQGSGNTAIGIASLELNTEGLENTAIGSSALSKNLLGDNNVAVGVGSLFDSVGSNNTAIGWKSLWDNTASNNTALGYESGFSNISGTGLTAIGYQALRASTGNSNTAIGQGSGVLTTGSQNTFVGNTAGGNTTTASNNVAVGHNAKFVTGTSSSAVSIGSNTTVGASGVGIGANVNTLTSTVAIGTGANDNFGSCVLLGREATSNAANQFVVGSTTYNAGTVTNLPAAQTHYWTIKINGTDYKVLLAL
jgi:hypothetical protein